jgi:hypothetical protein
MADAIRPPPPPSGTWASTEAKDVFAATAPLVAALAATETKDHADFEVFLPPRGTWASTEAKDTMAATGVPNAPLSLDAHVIGGAGDDPAGGGITSANVTLTTTSADDVIVLGIVCGGFNNNGGVTSVTDTAGLTWKKRNRRSTGGTTPITEIWWAHAPTALVGDVITVHTNLTGFIVINALAIAGANVNTPWDTHTGAGWYTDAVGSIFDHNQGSPTQKLYTNATKAMVLEFGSCQIEPTTVSAPGFTLLDTLTKLEKNGHAGILASAYRILSASQNGTDEFWFDLKNVPPLEDTALAVMQDVIVGRTETGTADQIRWFFDGPGTRSILALTGGNRVISQTVSTNNPNSIMVLSIMIQSGLGARVASVTDSAGHTGWQRRGIVTDFLGTTSLETWWCEFPTPFNGQVNITTDANTRDNDIIGFIGTGINGPSVFNRGEIWDGDTSLPSGAHSTGATHPITGPFNTLNRNVLEISVVGDTSTDPTGFNKAPWLQYLGGSFFGNAVGELVSASPPFNIALQFKFSAPAVVADTAELDISPAPTTGWLLLADALPVGLPSPPEGVWASVETKDATRHNGNFTAIGIASPGGWVGFPPNHAALAVTETKDKTTNSGAYTSIWDSNGWIGLLPLFFNLHVTERPDISSQFAWVLGPTTILARLETTETPDRTGFAGSHTSYNSNISTGDRTARITVTTNASLGGGVAENLVNGVKANGALGAVFVNNSQPAPMFFNFHLSTPLRITEAKWFQNGSSAQPGLWKWRGSHNNGATYEDIGTGTFTLNAGSGGGVIGDLTATPVGGYTDYQMIQTTNAGGNDTPWLWEIEFAAEGISGTMGATEAKDRMAGQEIVIPKALPVPPRKRKLLIVT